MTQHLKAGSVEGLVEKLEAAEVGNVSLDREVFAAAGYRVGFFPMDSCPYWVNDDRPDEVFPTDRECLTTSLDAALALAERVLPDLFWDLSCHAIISGERQHHAEVFPDTAVVEKAGFYGHAPTPALALCIAILKARLSLTLEGEG